MRLVFTESAASLALQFAMSASSLKAPSRGASLLNPSLYYPNARWWTDEQWRYTSDKCYPLHPLATAPNQEHGGASTSVLSMHDVEPVHLMAAHPVCHGGVRGGQRESEEDVGSCD